jgi:hypothetical protein
MDSGIRVYQAGDVADLPPRHAQELIHHQIAIPVVDTPAVRVEKAVIKPNRGREKR